MSEIVLTAGGAGGPGRILIIPDEHYLCDTPIFERTVKGVPDPFVDAWADQIKATIDSKAIPGWQAVLESEDTFLEQLATPAADHYPGYLNLDRFSRRGLSGYAATQKHGLHLRRSYQKLADAIAYQFGPGRDRFEARIDATKEAYREGATLPLALTGDALTGLFGAAVRQWWFLALSPKWDAYKFLVDYVEGSWPPDPPFLREGELWTPARRLVDLLVQGGVHMLQGIATPKIEEYLDDWLLNYLRAPYSYPPESSIRFTLVDGVPGIRTMIAY